MDLTVIGGAITGLRTAADIAKGLISANTTVEVNAKALELQRALLSAYADAISAKETQTALQEEIRELKSQLSSREEFAADMKRYKLEAPWPGAAVYALRQSMSNGEPPHYICSSCYQKSEKSILQLVRGVPDFAKFVCPGCKTSVQTSFKSNVPVEYASNPLSP